MSEEARPCAACERGRHDSCGRQVSAAGIECGCELCWGDSETVPCPACNGTGGQLPPFLMCPNCGATGRVRRGRYYS